MSLAAATANLAPFRFSTDDVPPSDRIAIWREVLGRVHLRLDVEPVGEQPLRATVEQHSWSSVSFYFSETTSIRASRTPELIRDGNGDFRLLRVEGGRCQLASNGVSDEINAPDSALLSSEVVSTIRYLGLCSLTSIRIRRECLAAAVPGVEDQPIQRIPGARPPLRLLAGYVDSLRRGGPIADPILAHRVAQHVVELTALALRPAKDTQARAAGAIREARLAAIRADVLANLSQVRLSAKTLAQRHGITDRSIHLLFEETGQTFGRFVLEERLKCAFKLLTDPSCAKRITDIASEVGFGDLSTFNRAFRLHFGDTPSGIRRSPRGMEK
jgi:AraC-like DNA-binding protein